MKAIPTRETGDDASMERIRKRKSSRENQQNAPIPT